MVEANRVSILAKSNTRLPEQDVEATPKRFSAVVGQAANDASLDHFIERDGMRFAGTHLIVDLWNATNLDCVDHVERSLRRATIAAGATLLNIDLHTFTPNGGVSGVAVLAESHISIHTWPERSYAAVDIFMCGDAEPLKAVAALREEFNPGMLTVTEHKRGVMP
ncbi:MAG: speD [Microvirga sp.]|jgi:S-adenosylmethionine decarboxylase|nr:speD [Microvirga sp.]